MHSSIFSVFQTVNAILLLCPHSLVFTLCHGLHLVLIVVCTWTWSIAVLEAVSFLYVFFRCIILYAQISFSTSHINHVCKKGKVQVHISRYLWLKVRGIQKQYFFSESWAAGSDIYNTTKSLTHWWQSAGSEAALGIHPGEWVARSREQAQNYLQWCTAHSVQHWLHRHVQNE